MRGDAHAIERAARTIGTVVSDFLTSQTIERGTLSSRRPCTVAELVADCVKQFYAVATAPESSSHRARSG